MAKMEGEKDGFSGGIIGVGNRGEHYVQRFVSGAYGAYFGDQLDSLAVADKDPEMRNKVIEDYSVPGLEIETYHDHQEMFEETDLDFVIEASNESSRVETLEDYIRNGVHVLAEKPLSEEIESSKKLAKMAQEEDVIAALGLNMNQFPAFLDAKKYVDQNLVYLNGIDIDWKKNRGDRDHPLREGVVEDLSHLFGFINELFDYEAGVDHVNYEKGQAIVDRKKYNNLSEEDKERIQLLDNGLKTKEDHLTYKMIQRLNLDLSLRDLGSKLVELPGSSPISSIRASYNSGEKDRVLKIDGVFIPEDERSGEITENEFYENMGTLTVDFAAEDDELAFKVIKGLKNGETRAGEGEIDESRYMGSYEKTDTLDRQLENFLDSLKTGELDQDLTSFDQALKGEEMVEEVRKKVHTFHGLDLDLL